MKDESICCHGECLQGRSCPYREACSLEDLPVPKRDAAIELRRLHTQRDALLEALKNIDKEFKEHGRQHWPEAVKARAAIAAAEGEAK